MPSSIAARTVRRTASTPFLWPTERGRPRRLAQRPLPSMMMATWRGAASTSLPAEFPLSFVTGGQTFGCRQHAAR